MFKQWKKRREEKAAAETYRCGYDLAAGRLLRGEEPTELECEVDQARGTDTYTVFDLGIEDALADFAAIIGGQSNGES